MRKKRSAAASAAVGVTHAMRPDPHRTTSARVETRRNSSSPSPSQAPMQPPINPEIIHRGGRGATLRGRRIISDATTMRPPTIASVDQRGERITHVVSTVQQAMRVPGQARDSGVAQGRGRGRVKPVLRRGFGRGIPSPRPGGVLENRPSLAPPPGPVAPQAECGSIMRAPPRRGGRGCRTGSPCLRGRGR